MRLLQEFGPFRVRLGLVTAFRDSKEYDVLKIDVEAPELHKIHYLLADNLKNEHSFPTYAPHMTLCYLKKGNADKYMGDNSFQDASFLVTDIKFCLKDSSKLSLRLGGQS
jgi:2'-5' RNA ligase